MASCILRKSKSKGFKCNYFAMRIPEQALPLPEPNLPFHTSLSLPRSPLVTPCSPAPAPNLSKPGSFRFFLDLFIILVVSSSIKIYGVRNYCSKLAGE